MTDKELRKLKRADILEIMIAQSKEIERLQKELEATKRQLEERELRIADAGSIAEAALGIYDVLGNAQKAADLYLENVRRLADAGTLQAPAGERSTDE